MKSTKGFANLSKDKLLEVSSRGGTSAWKIGKAHKWTTKEAQEANKKGLLIRQKHKDGN